MAAGDAKPPRGTTTTLYPNDAPKERTSERISERISTGAKQLRNEVVAVLQTSFQPSPADQMRLDAVLQPSDPKGFAHLAESWQERAFGALKEFPGFFGKTLLLCIVPCLCGFASISVASWDASLLISQFSHVTATYSDLMWLAEVRSTESLVAEWLFAVLTRASILLAVVLVLCSQVSPEVVLRSSRCTLLPLGVIHVAAGSSIVVTRSFGAHHIRDWVELVMYSSILVGFLSFVVQIGRRISNASFWWKMTIWFMVNFVLSYVSYEVLFAALPDSTDLHKALFVMIVAPAVTEVALTIGRFVTREIPERHEAASWVLNGCKRV
jgi:hypothetical protein